MPLSWHISPETRFQQVAPFRKHLAYINQDSSTLTLKGFHSIVELHYVFAQTLNKVIANGC